MSKVISLAAERNKRIILRALRMKPVRICMGYWDGPEARDFMMKVYEQQRETSRD